MGSHKDTSAALKHVSAAVSCCEQEKNQIACGRTLSAVSQDFILYELAQKRGARSPVPLDETSFIS
jgi:hypothetical protein